MENLTKENFWNEMKEKYPQAMERFCEWIDDYKRQVEWKKLFNTTYYPWKFHDLPLAMQFGIWRQFIAEVYGKPHFNKYWRLTIQAEIKDLNYHLMKPQKDALL
jgi:hypothetical protein